MESNSPISPFLRAQYAIQACNVASDYHPIQDIARLMPSWRIAWNSGPVTDPNYSFVAVNATEDVYILTTRGSVSAGDVFTQWDAFVDWILEDLNDALVHWPYASSSPAACISAGAYLGFTGMLLARNSLGAGESLHDFLLTNTTGNNKQLIITGHSLGGNLSNVYASYYLEILKQKNISASNVSLFTFAAPAAGNSDFANDLDRKLVTAWHYQNNNDAVPHFPTVQGLIDTGKFYAPDSPNAEVINVDFKDQHISLQAVFLLLSKIYAKYDYQQPKNNYITFTADFNPLFVTNTVDSWLLQVGSQHQLYNYAKELNVVLPPINEIKKPIVTEAFA